MQSQAKTLVSSSSVKPNGNSSRVQWSRGVQSKIFNYLVVWNIVNINVIVSARTRNTAVVRWMFVSCVWFKVAHNCFSSAQKQKRVRYFIFTFKNIHHAITYFYFEKHLSSGNFKGNQFLLTVLLGWNENCDVDVVIDRRAIMIF